MKYLALIAVAAVGLFAACSSDDSPANPGPGGTNTGTCKDDPWSCPAGQTCWVNDEAGAFKCLNSATGVEKGAACKNTISSPTCGDGLVCLQLTGTGVCTTFCDPAKAERRCAAGEDCKQVTLQGTSSSFYACVPRAGADAGTDAVADAVADAPAVDSASDTASETATDSGADAASTDAADGSSADASAD